MNEHYFQLKFFGGGKLKGEGFRVGKKEIKKVTFKKKEVSKQGNEEGEFGKKKRKWEGKGRNEKRKKKEEKRRETRKMKRGENKEGKEMREGVGRDRSEEEKTKMKEK